MKFLNNIDGANRLIEDANHRLVSNIEKINWDNKSEIPNVIGTQTVATSAWTGEAPTITELYDGLSIRYWMPYASTSSSVTLNLTLKGGASTGALACYFGGTSRLTTHYGAGNVITLTYCLNRNINGTNYTGWWAGANYADGTESYTVRWNSTHKVGAPIYDYKLCMFGTDGLLYPLTLEEGTGITKTVSIVEFDISSTILHYGTTTNIATEGTSGSYWYEGVTTSTLNYTANQSSGFIAYKPLYLKGKITAGGAFKLDNSTYTSWLTQTLPTTADGFVYILLGYMYNTTNAFRLTTSHPILEFKDGSIGLYTPVHSHSKANITDFPTSMPANGGRATSAKHLVGDDTRSSNYLPSDYMLGGSRFEGSAGWQTEFKLISTIGVGSFLTGTYCYLETKTPWTDPSGGYPIQIAYGNGSPCWRIGTGVSTWSAWNRLNSGGDADTLNGLRASDLNITVGTVQPTSGWWFKEI